MTETSRANSLAHLSQTAHKIAVGARWLLTGHTDHDVDVNARVPRVDEEEVDGNEMGGDDVDDGEASLNEGASPVIVATAPAAYRDIRLTTGWTAAAS